MSEDLIIHSQTKDLGGFTVARTLPNVKKRSVGPFVFLDHMGPMKLDEKHLLDVRPHPHIGLATVTYLLEGRGHHRDSLGSSQVIQPGDINLMIAGKGIVHSERTPEEDRKKFQGKSVHGLQIWMALPVEHEQCEPEFKNYPRESIPSNNITDLIQIEVLIGKWNNLQSPVKTLSRTLFLSLHFKDATAHQLNFEEKEIGLLIVTGSAKINDQELQTNDFIVATDARTVRIETHSETIIAVLGGDPFPEPRHIWWNLVSSQKELIHAAAEKWKNQQMGQVAGETDFIPLPSQPLP